ncbi:Apolipoprotein N-acyltransferase [Rhizoctonia solani]|uniref:Apolipoprotein N-acyltransferase n=1 Tax=Rhizoctonia solani TaxID=456999 RepID=A0A0K6FZD1_9AGAM|nr:Apolipoprotein N-acyltransferase [Rhizoctonia solani]
MLPDLKVANRLVERVESTRLVFRVFDDNSHQSYSPITGFTAEANIIDPSNLTSVSRSVERRVDFYSYHATPWISTSRRWLWAVWEANRRSNRAVRANHPNPNVRIAVIDLNACLNASKGISIPALGYNNLPFIHALSGLGNAEVKFQRFADMADEILIYQKVPASAVISIWPFDSCMSTLPSQFTHSLPPAISEQACREFRSNHKTVGDRFLEEWRDGEWDAGQVGELSATAALILLHDAHTRLVGEIGTTVKTAWVNVTRDAYTPVRRSARILSRMKGLEGDSNQRSDLGEDHLSPFPQTYVELLAHKTVDKLLDSNDSLCRSTIEAAMTQVVMNTPCGTDSGRSTYEKFLRHKKSVMAQVTNYIPANGLFIQIRRMRREVDRFRSVSLELARTVPLGLLDELHVTRVDWGTIKCRILESILATLAPLYKKLDALLIEPILRNELVDQAEAYHMDAGKKWLTKEIEYPLWWEQCGMQKSLVEHRPDARAWPESSNRGI